MLGQAGSVAEIGFVFLTFGRGRFAVTSYDTRTYAKFAFVKIGFVSLKAVFSI